MWGLRRNSYSSTWDRYVSRRFPRIQSGTPHADGEMEEWRVLNTTDRTYRWPGDEWGDRESALGILTDGVTTRLGPNTEYVIELGAGAGRYTVLALEELPDATVLSFDVSRKFAATLRERCAEEVESGRLRLFHLDADPSFLVRTVDNEGLRGRVDAIFSFDAMVHVDLHTLFVYVASATEVLRPGGVLAMNVADACNDRGFLKLAHDARSVYRLRGSAGGHFMWISRDIVHSMLQRFGFDVTYTTGNGRDLFFSATLVDAERRATWQDGTDMSWLAT